MLTETGARAGLANGPSMASTVTDLHARHYVGLVKLARTFVDTTASAEEIVQDAFERVIRRWDRLRDIDAIEAYLRRCVVNGCHDRIRRRAVRRAAPADIAMTALSAEDRALLTDRQQRLLATVRQLPARQRDVLLLRYFAELSEAEVAAALGISKGTVKSSAHKGLGALRSLATKEAWA